MNTPEFSPQGALATYLSDDCIAVVFHYLHNATVASEPIARAEVYYANPMTGLVSGAVLSGPIEWIVWEKATAWLIRQALMAAVPRAPLFLQYRAEGVAYEHDEAVTALTRAALVVPDLLQFIPDSSRLRSGGLVDEAVARTSAVRTQELPLNGDADREARGRSGEVANT